MNQNTYILKHFDKSLVEFHFLSAPLSGSSITITYIYKENKTFSPLGLSLENNSLLSWIKSRTIPENRDIHTSQSVRTFSLGE